MAVVRCLSIHADYRCRHSGACCSDVWAVPAEPRVVELVRRERIRPLAGGEAFVRAPAEASSRGLVLAQENGSCVFFDAERGRLCAIHRAAGADALPSSCRHFPRIHLTDARGTHVGISHFCPTAAAMLLADVPLAVTEAHPPLALDGDVEGFDAVGALPPLLRPGVLMDLDAYDAWERAGIATFARNDVTHEEAIAILAVATEIVRLWRPGGGPLEEAVRDAFDRARVADAPPDRIGDSRRLELVNAACPAAVRPVLTAAGMEASAENVWHSVDGPMKRYLAARLFANWFAYRGLGLRSVVEWLRVCLAVLRDQLARRAHEPGAASFIEAVRETDRIVLHVVESQRLAMSLEPLESDCDARA